MIALDEIEAAERLRPADAAAVEALARDIEQRGLRVPIEVAGQLRGKTKYRLVSGLHRLTAFRQLGRSEIPAFVVQGNRLELRRDEILENLTRSELDKLERCQFVAELKRVYLELHPEAAHGGDRRSEDFQDANDGNLKNWYESVAERSHRSARTVQREAQIGERLDASVLDMLRGSPIADNQKELEALSKFGGSVQRQLAVKIAGGEARSVRAAHRLVSGAPETADETDADQRAFDRLLDAWNRAPGKARARFLKQLCADGVLEPPGKVGGYRLPEAARDGGEDA
jgi:ParB family chromosome partitioning protein